MKVRTGKSLEALQDLKLSDEDLALEHRLNISASVYRRMKELGLNQKELASKLGMNEAQVSRIITAKQNLTISTLAKIENALDFNLGQGFRYESKLEASLSVHLSRGDFSQKAPSRPQNDRGAWRAPVSYSNERTASLEMVA